jgi:hypothetical protein
MKEQIKKIWKAVWAFIIPVITTAIISPLTNIINYEGIIIKKPVITKNTLIYNFVNTGKTIDKFIADYTVSNNQKYAVGLAILDEDPPNDNFVHKMFQLENTNEEQKIMHDSLAKGVYKLYIPIIKGEGTESEDIGNLRIYRENGASLEEIQNIRPYKFYDFRYFYSVGFSIFLFSILLIVTLTIKLRTKKKAKL